MLPTLLLLSLSAAAPVDLYTWEAEGNAVFLAEDEGGLLPSTVVLTPWWTSSPLDGEEIRVESSPGGAWMWREVNWEFYGVQQQAQAGTGSSTTLWGLSWGEPGEGEGYLQEENLDCSQGGVEGVDFFPELGAAFSVMWKERGSSTWRSAPLSSLTRWFSPAGDPLFAEVDCSSAPGGAGNRVEVRIVWLSEV